MSEEDQSILDDFKRRMPRGVSLFVAEWKESPGRPLKEKISQALSECDLLLAILTEDGARSEWVNQEIGVAHGLGKDIIPIKEKSVDVKGFIEGVEWITLDRFNPDVALEKTSSYLTGLHHQKVGKMRQDGIAWGLVVGVVVGILAFFLVAWAISRSD
jgi:hypothetical protein